MINKTPKERPILFSGPMVRAILDGRKTQTRRVVKPQPPERAIEVFDWRRPEIAESMKASEGCYYNDMDGLYFLCKCSYGKPGDRLWVRETWAPKCDFDPSPETGAVYAADLEDGFNVNWKWRPSIHMPRCASRLILEIVSIRVERLNDISKADARREGIENVGFSDKAVEIIGGTEMVDVRCWKNYRNFNNPFCSLFPERSFASLWESINGEGSWADNPYVWVIEFKRIDK